MNELQSSARSHGYRKKCARGLVRVCVCVCAAADAVGGSHAAEQNTLHTKRGDVNNWVNVPPTGSLPACLAGCLSVCLSACLPG